MSGETWVFVAFWAAVAVVLTPFGALLWMIARVEERLDHAEEYMRSLDRTARLQALCNRALLGMGTAQELNDELEAITGERAKVVSVNAPGGKS